MAWRCQEAARWFEKAGAKGHAEAQFNLGEMLWDAELPQDLEAGVLLFQCPHLSSGSSLGPRKAAQADLHAAQYKPLNSLSKASAAEARLGAQAWFG